MLNTLHPNKRIDNTLLSCDICYKDIKDKVSLECKHELCIACFLEMTTSSGAIQFKCHMCRRQYKWKKEADIPLTLSIPRPP